MKYKTDNIGDINCDGEISIFDATQIQKCLVDLITLTNEQKKNADTNSDGIINIRDVTEIQRYLAKLPSSLHNILS